MVWAALQGGWWRCGRGGRMGLEWWRKRRRCGEWALCLLVGRPTPPVVRASIVHIAPTVLQYLQKNESANNARLPAHQPTPRPRPDHPRRHTPEQR